MRGLLFWVCGALAVAAGGAQASDLDVSEGECIVFRFGAEERVLVDLQPEACKADLEEDTDPNVFWVFGDGHAAQGTVVAHQFADQGSFVARVSVGGVERELFEVDVANADPDFVGTPQDEAAYGTPWRFEFLVKDPGYIDQIRVDLQEGPEGMRLEPGDKECEWVLTWDPPLEPFGSDSVRVVLRAFDGGDDGNGWSNDGGEREMQFRIKLVDELSGNGDGAGQGDGGLLGDGSTGFSGDAFTGASGCDCDVGSASGAALPVFFGLLGLLGLRRRRRR